MDGYADDRQVMTKLVVENQRLTEEVKKLRLELGFIISDFTTFLVEKIEYEKLRHPHKFKISSDDIERYSKEFMLKLLLGGDK